LYSEKPFAKFTPSLGYTVLVSVGFDLVASGVDVCDPKIAPSSAKRTISPLPYSIWDQGILRAG
jgi:hypothetical protein